MGAWIGSYVGSGVCDGRVCPVNPRDRRHMYLIWVEGAWGCTTPTEAALEQTAPLVGWRRNDTTHCEASSGLPRRRQRHDDGEAGWIRALPVNRCRASRCSQGLPATDDQQSRGRPKRHLMHCGCVASVQQAHYWYRNGVEYHSLRRGRRTVAHQGQTVVGPFTVAYL